LRHGRRGESTFWLGRFEQGGRPASARTLDRHLYAAKAPRWPRQPASYRGCISLILYFLFSPSRRIRGERHVNPTQPIRRGAQGAAVANLQASLLRLPRRQVIRVSDTGHRALEKASAPTLRDRVCKTRSAKLIALSQKPSASRPGRRMDREHARERRLQQAR
jgi:hypothetical protein